MSNVDDELLFAPGLKYSEIKWDDDDALIEAFKERVKGFYLDPAQNLNDSKKYPFATGVLCVSTIDLLACLTISCNSGTVGIRFKQWIKEHITAFDSPNPNSELVADKFYDEFRNGLVNEGRIKNAMFFALWFGKVLQRRHRTRVTWIGRIFTDTFNPCVSVSSVHPRLIISRQGNR